MNCEFIAFSSDSAMQELRFNSEPHHKLPQVVRQVSTSERRPAVGLGRRRLPKFCGTWSRVRSGFAYASHCSRSNEKQRVTVPSPCSRAAGLLGRSGSSRLLICPSSAVLAPLLPPSHVLPQLPLSPPSPLPPGHEVLQLPPVLLPPPLQLLSFALPLLQLPPSSHVEQQLPLSPKHGAVVSASSNRRIQRWRSNLPGGEHNRPPWSSARCFTRRANASS